MHQLRSVVVTPFCTGSGPMFRTNGTFRNNIRIFLSFQSFNQDRMPNAGCTNVQKIQYNTVPNTDCRNVQKIQYNTECQMQAIQITVWSCICSTVSVSALNRRGKSVQSALHLSMVIMTKCFGSINLRRVCHQKSKLFQLTRVLGYGTETASFVQT